MKDIYFDNSATTRVAPEVAVLMQKLFMEDYGNPSSMHIKGYEAERYLKQARETLAKIWRVEAKEIIFTSGGTESDNMAVIGSALARGRQGKHIITSRIEHPAIKSACVFLEELGFEITYIGTDERGIIDLDELSSAVREDTILVSLMHVNNEIGTIQPVEEAAAIVKAKNPQCFFHVDDIQGYGKLALYPKKSKIDMISISGHKLHGPKGVGALYVSKDVHIKPVIYGGGQQNGMRSGTENVSGIAGMALACDLLYKSREKDVEHLRELRNRLVKGCSQISGVRINGGDADVNSAPHIVSVSVEGVRSEVLLHSLEDKGIYVSAGSACSSNKPAISETLKAIGLKKELLESTVRFSFCAENTFEEVDYAIECLNTLLPMLRKYTRH